MSSSNSCPSVDAGPGQLKASIAPDPHGNASSQRAKPMPAKGRLPSKLSSRHNRRKRRDREDNERPAKRTRRRRSDSDRVPIPSFTPISDYRGEGAECGGGSSSIANTVASNQTGGDEKFDATKQTAPVEVDNSNLSKREGGVVQRRSSLTNQTAGDNFASKPTDSKEKHEGMPKASSEDQSNPPGVLQMANIDVVSKGAAARRQPSRKSWPIAGQNIASGTPITSALSSSEAAPKILEQPNAQNSAKRGPDNQCLPSEAGGVKEGTQKRARKDINSGQTHVKSVDQIEKINKDTIHPNSSQDRVAFESKELLEKPQSDLVIVSHNEMAKSSETLNTTSGPPDDKQQICNNKGDNISGKIKPRKRKGSNGVSVKSSPPEVIEIIDDDHNEAVAPKAKKKQPVRRRKANENDACRKKSTKSKQNGNESQPPISISRSSSDSNSSDGEIIVNSTKSAKKTTDMSAKRRKQTTVKVKENKSSNGKKMCFACASCKCNSRAGSSATPQKPSSLSGSDARREQSLINRIQRIERDIAWKDGQRNEVARELKKHRGKMLKKWEAQPSNVKSQKPRYLADADASEDWLSLETKPGLKEVNRAQARIFGRQKTHQPTLTQIVRGPKDADEGEHIEGEGIEAATKDISCQENESNEQHEANPTADHNFLQFWDDSEHLEKATQCFGSMRDFNRAVAKSKRLKSTGGWARATANELKMEEDGAFDALVDLFDESMKNGTDGLSQNSYGADESPSSSDEKAQEDAKMIKSSIEADQEQKDAIERMCPQWKENVDFVQAQTDASDLHGAMENITRATAELENMKERILQAFLDRHQTLYLYQRSLQAAIDRLPEKEEGAKSECID
ncbi:hypothetical protein ACHAWF_016628 [Thalassiosira exigua]